MNGWKCSDNNINEKVDSYSLTDIWPTFENYMDSKSDLQKLKSPTFRNYIFRKSPPADVSDYFPISVPLNSKCHDESSKLSSYHYTPAHSPPAWPTEDYFKELKKFEEKIVDELTIDSASKGSFPLFDFSGDFFLKFIVLECYGTIFNVYYYNFYFFS